MSAIWLRHSTTVTELAALFSRFGSIVQLRQGSGSAIVKMDTHENAATAIAELTSYEFHGQPLKCSVAHVPRPS
jgi:nucleolysin TIA-1/TIAR